MESEDLSLTTQPTNLVHMPVPQASSSLLVIQLQFWLKFLGPPANHRKDIHIIKYKVGDIVW
jgi:hypothetical protein